MPLPNLPNLPPFLLVALGAALGGAARYLITQAMAPADARALPWATVLINVGGCLLIGLAAPFILGGNGLPPTHGREPWRWFALVGVLGGFTTFSTFGFESLRLAQQGVWGLTLAYVGASVVGSLGATWLGWLIGSAMAAR